ncbi:MAG: hypothetical protein WBO34_02000 [Gammaproteobacteria bacterium]
MNKLHRKLLNTLLALVLAVTNTAFVPTAAAADVFDPGEPSGEAMLFDGVLVRPAMLVATAAGIIGFVVTLPFSLLGGNIDKAGKELVMDPAAYTFVRPLGEM